MTDKTLAEQQAHALLETDPVAQQLGLEIVSATSESTTVRMRPEPHHLNAFDMLHGGYVFLLADTAFAYSAAASGVTAVTHTAEVTYMAPTRGAVVEAESRILHRYGKNVLCQVEVRDETGEVRALLNAHGIVVRSDTSVG